MAQDREIWQSNKHVILGILITLIVFLGIFAYYQYRKYFPATDDAYVGAPLIQVSPKINGNIKHLYIYNNQYVHKGDLLIEIDPKNYILLIRQAKLDLVVAKQAAVTAKQQMINAESNVIKAQSNLTFSNQMAVRYTNMYKQKAGSEQSMQKFINDQNIARKEFEQSKVVLEQANVQYEMAKAKIKLAKLQVENSCLTNSYTKIYSPVNGYVSRMNLQVGQLVEAGEKIFGLVDDSAWWIDANFKESDIYRIKPKQKVSIKLDMYNHKYKGYIQSISYTSGNTFSLLPAQNATGNWVKVVQRFPVRIYIKNNPNFPLRVGASASVVVRTLQ